MQRPAGPARWALASGIFLFHLALMVPLQGPMLFQDESLPLATARYLAGRAPDLQLATSAAKYGAYVNGGYPILLTPVAALTGPHGLYRAAQLLNAACCAAAFLILAAFACGTLGLSQGEGNLAALVASLYPTTILTPGMTWPESPLLVLVPGLAVAFHATAKAPSTRASVLFGACAGAAYWVHQRAIGLIPLTLLALWWLWRSFGLTRRAAFAGALTAVGIGLGARVSNSALWALLCARGAVYGEGMILSRLFSRDGLREAALSALGHLWYLGAATLGLGLIGAWVLLGIARARIPATAASSRAAAYFALAVAGVLFLTSVGFTTIPDRVDKLFYGRYWEPAFGLLLAAAMAWLLARAPGRKPWLLFASTTMLAVLLIGARGSAAFTGIRNDLTILGIAPWITLWGQVRVLRIAAASTAIGFTLAVLARKRPRIAACCVAGAFLALALFFYERTFLPVNREAQISLRIPHRLAEIGSRAAVSYDEGHVDFRGFHAYGLAIASRALRWFDSRVQPPPSELIISSWSWPEAPPGTRLLYPESLMNQALWVLPGQLQRELGAAGRLMPEDRGAPLPPNACRSGLTIVDPAGRYDVRSGGARDITVRVRHRGSGAPWVSGLVGGETAHAVRLAIRWSRGGAVVADRRAELPFSLAPGDSVDVAVRLDARDAAGNPLPAGAYVLRLGLVQELVQWFSDAGDSDLVLAVDVLAASPP